MGSPVTETRGEKRHRRRVCRECLSGDDDARAGKGLAACVSQLRGVGGASFALSPSYLPSIVPLPS